MYNNESGNSDNMIFFICSAHSFTPLANDEVCQEIVGMKDLLGFNNNFLILGD